MSLEVKRPLWVGVVLEIASPKAERLESTFDHPVQEVDVATVPTRIEEGARRMAAMQGCDDLPPIKARAGLNEDRTAFEFHLHYRRKA